VAAARVAVVRDVIAGQAEKDGVGRDQLDRSAHCGHILVVIAKAVGEVLAEAVVAETCSRRTDQQAFGERGRSRHDQVGLTISAEVGPHAQVRAVGRDAPSHIFDRATDRVATV
jgi:hypothetical protein